MNLQPFLCLARVLGTFLACSSTVFSMLPREGPSSPGASNTIITPSIPTDQAMDELEGRLDEVYHLASYCSVQLFESNSNVYLDIIKMISFELKEIVTIYNGHMDYFNQITDAFRAEIMASKHHSKKDGKGKRAAMLFSYDSKMKNHARLVAVRTRTQEITKTLPTVETTQSTILPNGKVVPAGDARIAVPDLPRAERRMMDRLMIETEEVLQREGSRCLSSVLRSHSAVHAAIREQEAEAERRAAEQRQEAKVAALEARRKIDQEARKQRQERQVELEQEQAASPEYQQAQRLSEQARREAASAAEQLEREKQAARELEYRTWRMALRALAEARDANPAPEAAAAAASVPASSEPERFPILFQWDTRARNELARLKDVEGRNAILHLIADIEQEGRFSSSKDSKPIEGVDNLFELRPMGGTHACRPLYTRIGGNIFVILTLGGKNHFSNDIKRAQSRMLQFHEAGEGPMSPAN